MLGLIGWLLLGGSDRHPPRPLSRADYVAQSDAICSESTRTLSTLQPPPDTTDGAATAQYLTAATTQLRAELTKLSSLQPPVADKDLLLSLHQRQEQTIRRLEAAAADYRAGHPKQAASTLQPIAAGAEQLQAGYRSYGFKVCGRLNNG